jgi:L-rhamnose mutarotase
MQQKVTRYGAVVEVRPEKRDYYKALHADPWPEINAMIRQCNIRNYSIYEAEIAGKVYLFSYFEYVGPDFQADMAKMAADPKTQEWWAECIPCMIPLPDTPAGGPWKPIAEVYHLD